jgi:hypothetical protein
VNAPSHVSIRRAAPDDAARVAGRDIDVIFIERFLEG